jgi:Tfp pilus assembly PilM family ATPase
MPTTIELTTHAIRLCREERGRLSAVEEYPIAEGQDALQALAEAALPAPLGRVRVALHGPDMLIRTMVQPACPPDRLDRIVRFELANTGDREEVTASWHLVRAMGSGDMRLLTMMAKRSLIAEVRQALKAHGGTLIGLTTPALGLFHSYRAMQIEEEGASILLDLGGASTHLALVQDGELVFLRSQSPGAEDLVAQVADVRRISTAAALDLLLRIRHAAPSDIQEAVRGAAAQIATLINANIKFAKAQLRIDSIEPKTVWVAGGGAQLPGLCAALGERLGMLVRPINPFIGLTPAFAPERMDELAILPSPWATTLGVARAPSLELDALSEERQGRERYWRTEGVLRLAAAICVLLVIAAGVRQSLAIATSAAAVAVLEGDDGKGLVPRAEAQRTNLDRIMAVKVAAAHQLAWLDGQSRPGRIAAELLNAIAAQEDPVTCQVLLQSFRVQRAHGQVVVAIEGFAQSSGTHTTDNVLHTFERGLVRRYPAIAWLQQTPMPIDSTKQQFHYLLGITDTPTEVVARSVAGDGTLQLRVRPAVAADPEAVARVAAIQARDTQPRVEVTVLPVGHAGQPQAFPIDFSD